VSAELAGRRTFTVAEASAELGVSRQVVRRRLRGGQLRGFRLRDGLGAWRVYASQLRETES